MIYVFMCGVFDVQGDVDMTLIMKYHPESAAKGWTVGLRKNRGICNHSCCFTKDCI